MEQVELVLLLLEPEQKHVPFLITGAGVSSNFSLSRSEKNLAPSFFYFSAKSFDGKFLLLQF